MNNHVRKRIISSLILAVFATVGLSTATYWFVSPTNTLYTDLKGSLVQERFHSGNGSESDPFVITRPIHYYHMVEFFQRITNLPTSTSSSVRFGTDYLYFKIGCCEQKLYNPSLIEVTDPALVDDTHVLVDENTQYYVFDYTNYGDLNTDINANGDKSQKLNMAYYSGSNSLMPIGSSEVPFYGQLDGHNLILDNLNIISQEDVIVTDENEVSTRVTRKTNDIGMFGYVSSDSLIKDLYIDGINITLVDAETSASIDTSIINDNPHVSSHDSMINVGYIAGHINLNSSVSNVYVNNCTISGGSESNCGYGYFGLVDDESGVPISSLASQVTTTTNGSGQSAGFGGSFNSKSYNDWIGYVSSQNGFSGNTSLSTSYNTLQGTGYKAYFTASYNTVPATSDYALFQSILKGVLRQVKLYYDGTGQLIDNGSGNTYNFTWESKPNNNIIGYKCTFPSNVTLGNQTKNVYYFNIENSNSSKYFFSISENSTSKITNYTYIFTAQIPIVYRNLSTHYIPLKFASSTWYNNVSNTVASDNTGYIVGSTGPTAVNGAVKLASYPISYINNSINDTNLAASKICRYAGLDASYSNSTLEVLTYDETNSKWVLIKDTNNSGHTVSNSAISSYTKSDATTPTALSLQRYDVARTALHEDVLDGQHQVHAIHFDSPASGYEIGGASNISSYSNVTVNNHTYASYQMPQGTVDFNLIEPGYITFFAGAYNSSDVNMSFFSLYEIERDGNNNISSITEIRKIYENPNYNGQNDKYVYSYDTSTPTGATKCLRNLDNSLRVSSVPVKNALYYFEIPVNQGEYAIAISSSSSNQGAYMLYLDIGANAGEGIPSLISATGNEIKGILDIDFRDAGETSPWAILQFSINCPAVDSSDKFSVFVNFDANASNAQDDPGGEYNSGLYTITIVNKSDVDLSLSVFLCDDDNDSTNAFSYAYRIIYTNNTVTDYTVLNGTYDIFKAVKTFALPHTGAVD